MKRFSILLFCMVVGIAGAFGQKGKVYTAKACLDANDVDGALKAIEPALLDEKSNTWPETYITAAKVYIKLKKEGKDNDGLKKAFDYYMKAVELDQQGDINGKNKGKYKNALFLELDAFKKELYSDGVDGFQKEDFKRSIFDFESVLKIGELPVMITSGVIDTSTTYNVGLAAYNAKEWDTAEKYFIKVRDLGYGGGDVVLYLNQIYITKGDSLKMGENLKSGFERYPDDSRLLTNLIQFYISSNQNEEALTYLNTAISKDPENPVFYYARGVLYDERKDKVNAEADYVKSLEMDGENFYTLYRLGLLNFNQGVDVNNAAQDLTDLKKFNEQKNLADNYFKKSLDYMNKGYDVLETNPKASVEEKVAVLDILKDRKSVV